MSTFGTKHRRDYNAQDNANLAMSTMLGAELRERTQKATDKQRMALVMGTAFVGSLIVAICLTATGIM